METEEEGTEQQPQNEDIQPQQQPKNPGKPSPAAMRWVAGCALGVIVLLGVVSAGLWHIISVSERRSDERIEQLKAEGYKIIEENTNIDVDKQVTEKTLFKSPGIVSIIADCDADIVVVAKSCNVSGNINGKMFFYGDQLTVGSDSIIKELDGAGQVAFVNGKIEKNMAVFESTMHQNSK